MRTPRGLLVVIVTALVCGGLLAAAPPASVAAQEPVCLPETGQCIAGRFLTYWQAHGGLALNGYPLTGERQELLEDGKSYTVQYFERVRMEYHPENPPPWDVLLGQFGRRIHPADPPTTPIPGQVYFPEIGHNLGGGFLQYWQANSGLAQFGYPLTEERTQTLEDGKPYTVQYFERARFEYHPENQPPWDIELGQFGRRILAENMWLSEATQSGEIRYTPFGILYITNAEARKGGAPQGPAVQVAGMAQEFERGRMIYLSDQPKGTVAIITLCNEGLNSAEAAGVAFLNADTWDASQPVGGGPGPQPGLYEPRRGFGKVWRANAYLRSCVGYATTPDEQATVVTIQDFGVSRMLTTADTDTIDIIAPYIKYGWSAGNSGRFRPYSRP